MAGGKVKEWRKMCVCLGGGGAILFACVNFYSHWCQCMILHYTVAVNTVAFADEWTWRFKDSISKGYFVIFH